ncbi:VOC family protein [Nocardioides terrisoli]|uniref:VOC family protein n=1 Tax=Nocardioides terrisoli TaxID=3388267 RepID=UPI00287B8F78|nr:VOC family protein [Nocardioides marmorisolisilvae]
MWLTAFLDLPADGFDDGVAFWQAVTGLGLSGTRGDSGQFATLVADDSDDWLRVQRVGAGGPRVHLDVHSDDPARVRDHAIPLGARLVDESDVVVMASPGGLPFCAVTGAERRPPRPRTWDGHSSLADQVCIDIPPALFDQEAMFWSRLLDRELQPSPGYDEFASLARHSGDSLRVLLQRLESGDTTRAHLDLACDDRDAEVSRLRRLGATEVRRTAGWTTLRGPAGMELCVTDRRPGYP